MPALFFPFAPASALLIPSHPPFSCLCTTPPVTAGQRESFNAQLSHAAADLAAARAEYDTRLRDEREAVISQVTQNSITRAPAGMPHVPPRLMSQ